MTAAAIVTGAIAITALPWLKWCVTPVVIAFEIGRRFERIRRPR